MKNVIFREERVIDREKEIKFFKGWFEKLPEEILWVYGSMKILEKYSK